jgi:hypothetical protein
VQVREKSSDASGAFAKSDAVVKLKAFEFCFRPDPADYVPEPDFVPLLWANKDDGDGGGEGNVDGGDDAMGTSEVMLGPPQTCMMQSQLVGSGDVSSGGTRTVVSNIAVTLFNPNPRTPMGMDFVTRLREIIPSLEGRSHPVVSQRV